MPVRQIHWIFCFMDRSGNRRFLPILCKSDEAEVHILDDEKASREYIDQMWAEAMVIYRSGDFQLKTLQRRLRKSFGSIRNSLCRKIPRKSLFLIIWSIAKQIWCVQGSCTPKRWGMRKSGTMGNIEINDIMNNCSDWIAFSNPDISLSHIAGRKDGRSLTTKVGIFNRLPRSRWNSYHYRQSGCSNNCPVGCRLVVYPVVNLVVGSIFLKPLYLLYFLGGIYSSDNESNGIFKKK